MIHIRFLLTGTEYFKMVFLFVLTESEYFILVFLLKENEFNVLNELFVKPNIKLPNRIWTE